MKCPSSRASFDEPALGAAPPARATEHPNFWRAYTALLGSVRCAGAHRGRHVRSPGAARSSLSPAPSGLYRAWRGLCLFGLVSEPSDGLPARSGLDSDLALSRAVALAHPQEGAQERPRAEADLSRARRLRSRTGRAVHERGQAAEFVAASRAGRLPPLANHLSAAFPGCLVDVRHRRQSGQAQLVRFFEPQYSHLRARVVFVTCPGPVPVAEVRRMEVSSEPRDG